MNRPRAYWDYEALQIEWVNIEFDKYNENDIVRTCAESTTRLRKHLSRVSPSVLLIRLFVLFSKSFVKSVAESTAKFSKVRCLVSSFDHLYACL